MHGMAMITFINTIIIDIIINTITIIINTIIIDITIVTITIIIINNIVVII